MVTKPILCICVLLPLLQLFLPSATKFRRLCFYRCVSVHGGGGGGWYPSMPYRWYPSMPCSRTMGGVLSQHALQVVSQHALQQVSRGCLFLGDLLWEGGCLVWGVLVLGGCLLRGVCSRGGGGGWYPSIH